MRPGVSPHPFPGPPCHLLYTRLFPVFRFFDCFGQNPERPGSNSSFLMPPGWQAGLHCSLGVFLCLWEGEQVGRDAVQLLRLPGGRGLGSYSLYGAGATEGEFLRHISPPPAYQSRVVSPAAALPVEGSVSRWHCIRLSSGGRRGHAQH